jgi:hypothetical protein
MFEIVENSIRRFMWDLISQQSKNRAVSWTRGTSGSRW